jgi:hypothetical protein
MLNCDPEIDDRPRSMRDLAVQQRRLDMLRCPHIAALTDMAIKWRDCGRGKVPDFDPGDGGQDARVLFLFEKPGPMTVKEGKGKRPGSGFISCNNDDPTAENTFNFMKSAGIPRKQTVIWNVVPWWNGTRKVTTQELGAGIDCVKELIVRLESLRVVMMVGCQAAKAEPYLRTRGLQLFTSYHPANVVRAFNRIDWETIPSEWAKVIPHLGV